MKQPVKLMILKSYSSISYMPDTARIAAMIEKYPTPNSIPFPTQGPAEAVINSSTFRFSIFPTTKPYTKANREAATIDMNILSEPFTSVIEAV